MDLFLSSTAHTASVEGESGNGSNVTLKEPCVDCLVFAPFYLIMLVFTVSIFSLVVAAKAIPCAVRFVLANILIANITAGLGIFVIVLARIIVSRVQHFSLTDGPCRFLIAFVSVGGTSRPLMMAVYAVVVFIIIMKSISAVKFKLLFICVLIMWLVCVTFSATVLFPIIVKVSTMQDTACVPRSGPYSLVYTVPFFVCFLFIPFTLDIVILIMAFYYVRDSSVSANVAHLRPLLKFCAFLLLGNLLSAVGHSTPVIAAYVDSPAPDFIGTINRTNSCIILLSLIPTPILILVYFRPVRALMKQSFLCVCIYVGKKTFIISEQKHSADKMLFSRGV